MGRGKDTRKKKGGSGGGGGQGQGGKGSRVSKQRKKVQDSGASGGKRGKKKAPDADGPSGGAPSPRATKKRGADDGSSDSDRNVKHKSSSSEEGKKRGVEDGISHSDSDRNVKHRSSSSEEGKKHGAEDGSSHSDRNNEEGSPEASSPVSQESLEAPETNPPVTIPGFIVYRKETYQRSSAAKRSERVLRPIGPQPTKVLRSRSSSETSSASVASEDSRSSSQVTPGKSFADATKDEVSSGSSIGHRPYRVPSVVRQSTSTLESVKQPTAESVKQPEPTKSKQPVTDKCVSDKLVSFLELYIAPGEKMPYYPIELKGLKERGSYELKIHFQDILKHDKELAFEILKR